MSAPYCYLNGRLVPEREAVVPITELGTQLLYDSARTYGGEPKLLRYHLERVWDGVRYFGFELGLTLADLDAAIRATLAANADAAFIAQGGDYQLLLKLSGTPLVCITTPSLLPLFRSRAKYYRSGIAAVVASSQRHVPPQCIDPRLKIPRPWFQLALREVRLSHPGAWEYPLMMDLEGNVAEFAAGNYFLVQDGELHTPGRNVLLGSMRHLLIEVARAAGIVVHERDLNLLDLYGADEMLMTATSYGVLPVASVNGVRIGPHQGFGPVGQRLHDGLSQRVGLNFQAQYERWAAAP